MKHKIKLTLEAALFLALSFSVSAAKPAWVQLSQLTASDGQPMKSFGNPVSISGNTIVVSSPSSGAAYVFVKPQNGWPANMAQLARLTASDGQAQDCFGSSVSISGDTIVVGAPCATANGSAREGAAYVFVRPTNGWTDMTETAKLTTSDGQSGDGVGIAACVNDTTVALGAPNKTVNGFNYVGEVYVYSKPSTGWANTTETAKFSEPGNTHNQSIQFGSSVALGGGTLAVGAPSYRVGSDNGGVIFLFVKAAHGWKHTNLTARLEASKELSQSDLGISVAISRDGRTVVGGSNDGSNPGRALIFVRPTSGWSGLLNTETAILSDGTFSSDEFGGTLAISGSTVIVGAWGPFKLGAAYVFSEPTNGWTTGHKYEARLTALDEDVSWTFGGSASISGSVSVVGAPGWSDSQGSAFVFGKLLTSSFTPTSGPVGTSVVITGENFGQTTAVGFGGVDAITFTVNSDTQVTASVPSGAVTGNISITTPGGTATSSKVFTLTQ